MLAWKKKKKKGTLKGNSRWLIICSIELINAVFISEIAVSDD